MSLTRNLLLLGVALGSLAGAQTKISGTLTCAKPDTTHVLPVGDHKGHILMMAQVKCTWTKPIEMEGVQTKDDLGAEMSDVHGANSKDIGYDVTTMSNGDKIFVYNSGTSTLKGEALDTVQGKWRFTGGTGKFK